MSDSNRIETPWAKRGHEFIQSLSTGRPGEYRFWADGQVSLYSSCWAALALQSLGQLATLPDEEKKLWAEFVNSWQDPQTGYFLGPELRPDERIGGHREMEYLRQHLIIHVLPVLELLNSRPGHPLTFARRYAGREYLVDWLNRRDWRQAWLEGNNLIFAGQLLTHLAEIESYREAGDALAIYFNWLDKEQDPATGLWGTNGFADKYQALYGATHQLIIYFYHGREVKYSNQIIDTVLELQHRDGSFTVEAGGGSCEDYDAVVVLSFLAARTGYRYDDISAALRKATDNILSQQTDEGGFVFNWGSRAMGANLTRTFAPRSRAELFSTWFRLHSLAVINTIIDDSRLDGIPWSFNRVCSMGWFPDVLE